MSRTPAQLAAIRAFREIVEAEGAEEAHSFLIEIGDMFSVWPQEPVFEDIGQRAAQVVANALAGTACSQRGSMLRAMSDHVAAGRRVLEAACPVEASQRAA